MGFWSAYQSSLKSRDVEEPIDLWVHRRAGYAIARLAFPTGISPNKITALSIVSGALAGAAFCIPFPLHLPIGALWLFFSTVLDCADGQLARMRGSASAAGRMLDGVGDGITLLAVVTGTSVVLFRMYKTPPWCGFSILGLTALTVLTSSFHTAGYDHYKNLYLRLTCPDAREGEDLEAASLRYEAASAQSSSIGNRAPFLFYLGYLKWQRAFLRWFDPYTVVRLDTLPGFDAAKAAIYKKHALAPMRIWRSFFGIGSLVFGLALLNALGRPDVVVAFRLLVLNAVFFFYLGPLQRQASRKAFEELT
jgi:hypothetical protein